jgi:hypothetical protein
VPGMSPPPAPQGRAVRLPRRQEQERRRRRLAVLVVALVVGGASLLVTAFGGGDHPAAPVPAPASASRLLPAGPPAPEVIARYGSLHLQLPVSQSRVTAIGYHGGTEGALALTPVGTQVNQGLFGRLVHKLFGGGSGDVRWYQLSGGLGASTSALDIGASAGTDVYSPVDGTVVGLHDLILNGRPYGQRLEIQPTGSPSIVVTVSHLRADPSLTVGSAVVAGSSRLGTLLDFSAVEKQSLARFTQDAGNHVSVEIHPAATLSIS